MSSSPAAALVHIRTPEAKAKEGERVAASPDVFPADDGDDYGGGGGDDWQHRRREEDGDVYSPSDHRDKVHFPVLLFLPCFLLLLLFLLYSCYLRW